MKDRILAGITAGLIGGVAQLLGNLFSFYVLHFTKRLLFEWMAVILYGHFARNLSEKLFAQFVWFLWAAVLGVVLAYVFPFITSRRYLLRGSAFGFATYLLIYAITMLFKLPGLDKTAMQTSMSTFVGSQIFGLVAAYVLFRLDNPVGTDDSDERLG